MAKVLLLSLASALVTAQQPRFIQQSDFSQQANYDVPTPIDPTISFNYGYEINDIDTGNAQAHQEALENGVLKGSYSVVQPDGKRRIVDYVADEISGFQAKVRYESGYPIQTPSQNRPSNGGVASSQGIRSSSGSSSSGSSPRRPRPSPPSQSTRFPGSSQSHRFTGVPAGQQQIFPAGTSQGPGFRPPSPTVQGTPSRFNERPPSQKYQSQSRPSGSVGVSASQGSRFRPASFPAAPTSSFPIDASTPAGHLPQLSADINSIRNPQGGVHRPRGSLVSSTQAGQSSAFSGHGTGPQVGPQPFAPGFPRPRTPANRPQGSPFSSPRPQVGSRPDAPGSPRQVSSAIRAPAAVQIAPNGFFPQRGIPSSPANAGISGAAFDAASQGGISGASFGALAQAGFSRPGIQQDRSSSRFVAGAPKVSIQSSDAFQSGQGSRFAAGPAFEQLISSSLLVTDENLDSIDAIELENAGFGDSSYAYRLVPVPVNN